MKKTFVENFKPKFFDCVSKIKVSRKANAEIVFDLVKHAEAARIVCG